ncbi:MAG: hypothetical protein FJ362_07830 [Gemmatimonadetes bacterium]|nr:hypothetical protein [Gemmatimonadota bacterium]MBM4190863.1 DUF4384 domain-containing protein [Gemmatimonadota bacterium]
MLSRAVLVGTALVATTPLVGGRAAQAQTPGPGIEVPRAEGRATFTEEMSLKDVRTKALTQALQTAVGEALGRRLTAMTQVTTYEDSAGVSETFAEIVREAAQGIVTSHAILEETWEKGDPFTPGATYRVVVRATVRRDPASAPPGFRFAVKANQGRFYDRGTPESSDELILTVDADEEVYLTVFLVTSDSVEVLFPNMFMPRVRVRAGQKSELPSLAQRQQGGIHLRTILPDGVQRRAERLVVVATKRYVPYEGIAERRASEDAGEVPLIRATLDALLDWLLDIPASERALGDVAYEIVREKK